MALLVHHQKPLTAPNPFCGIGVLRVDYACVRVDLSFFLHTCWLKECAMANRGRLVARHFYELASEWMKRRVCFIDSSLRRARFLPHRT
jgi:hypothetical protein